MDDHCILTCGGHNWRIQRVTRNAYGGLFVEGGHLLDPSRTTRMDLSAVNWDSYIAAAVEKIALRDAEDVSAL